jgi:hypothetical protein
MAGALTPIHRSPARPPSFIQTFPNFRLFSPNIRKESFGGFVGFQRVAIDPNNNCTHPNFAGCAAARPGVTAQRFTLAQNSDLPREWRQVRRSEELQIALLCDIGEYDLCRRSEAT